MALIDFEVTPDRGAAIDQTFTRSSSRRYRAITDSTDDETWLILNCGISIGSANGFDPQQRCVGISARSKGLVGWPGHANMCLDWDVEVDYGPWNPLELSFDGDPTTIPANPRFDVEIADVPCLVDVDGNPIVNSAGDYYDPPVEREEPRITLVVLRNEAAPSIATLLALANVTNGAAWNGFPPKTVRFLCPAIPNVQYCQATGSFYWPMEYTFKINFDTWVKQVLNRGFRQLKDGKLVPIFVNGQPIHDPVFLDQDGVAILTPDYLESSGDAPGESDPSGYSGEVAGGGEPPDPGSSTEGGSIDPNAYDVYRTYDFTNFHMDSLFTLPSVF